MRVVFGLVSFVFALISVFAGIAKWNDIKVNTTYETVSKILTVKEKTSPKGFSVKLTDNDGKEYFYEQNWCNNHNFYNVGSKHTVKFELEIYKKNTVGYSQVEVIEKFKLDCK